MDDGPTFKPRPMEPWYLPSVRDESATATQTVSEPHESESEFRARLVD